MTLKLGVYYSEAATTSTGGVLTLNGGPKDVWIFLSAPRALALTGTNFSVDMTGGADPCNVYWWVAEGVTMTDSDLVGTHPRGRGHHL